MILPELERKVNYCHGCRFQNPCDGISQNVEVLDCHFDRYLRYFIFVQALSCVNFFVPPLLLVTFTDEMHRWYTVDYLELVTQLYAQLGTPLIQTFIQMQACWNASPTSSPTSFMPLHISHRSSSGFVEYTMPKKSNGFATMLFSP